MERRVGSGRSQAVVEGEITLPGGLREEARVLYSGGMVVIDGVEALQDRVSVTGKVVFHTLYTQGDPSKINAMEATADFSHTMELPGVQPRMACLTDATVEHVEATAYSGRLGLRAILQISARAMAQQPVEALTGISGVAGLELKPQQLSIKRTVAMGEGETLLREEFSLPEGLQIRDTLCASALVQTGDVTGGLGRIGVNGSVQLEVIHASELPGKPLVVTRHTIPFDQAVELTGEDGDILNGRATVRDVAVASQETAEGERTLRVEVLLGLNAWADRQENVTLLEDAYTTGGEDLSLTREQVCYRTADTRSQTAESGKLMLMLPEGSPAARTVLCGFASPILTGREQIGGRLTLEGMLEVTLLYMTDDSDVPVTVFQEEPFRITFAAEAGQDDFLFLQVGDVDVSAITSDRVEMKYIMHLTVSGMQTAQAALVTDAEPAAADAPSAGIILCFAQGGETLWDIARRYRVPMALLKELNPDLTGEPRSGQGVVVWHRACEC